MFKKICLMGICFVAASAGAHYEGDCVGGTIITANSYANDKGGYCDVAQGNCNGDTFCLSTVNGGYLTWWSAHLWCESNGGRLASFYEVCPGVSIGRNGTDGACPNMTKAFKDGWFYVLETENKSISFSIFSNGNISANHKHSGARALCVN